VQYAVHAGGGGDQLRQAHHVGGDGLETGIAGQMLDGLGRALEEIVEDDHLGRTFGEQQLGGGGAYQAGATHDQETAFAQGKGMRV
jgi:hypothetical protein